MQDPLRWMSAEDPEMIKAILAAQATFLEFARQAELENFRSEVAFDEIALKAFFPHPDFPDEGEHLFATFVATNGVLVEAILDADPYVVPHLKENQRVSFPITYLSDWLLVANGRGLGGFTLDVMLRYMPADQLVNYSAHPPYCWYRGREMDALAELERVPLCGLCGCRGLIEELYQDGLCGPCAEGYVRCQCADCGAPLWRHPGQVFECASCLYEGRTPPERISKSAGPEPVMAYEPVANEPAPGEERRGSFRLNRIVGAEILHEGGLVSARLFVIDISFSGFRATSHFDLPDSPQLRIRIFLEPKAAPIESAARIVWKNKLEVSGTIQFGFEFLNMESDQREHLDHFIQSERRRGLAPKSQPAGWVPWTPRFFG